VKTLTSKIFTLDVEVTVAVDDMKARIPNKEGFPPDLQRSIFACKRPEEMRLGDEPPVCNVQKKSILRLGFRLHGGLQIFAKNLADNTMTREGMFLSREGVLPDQRRVTFAGKLLEDGPTLWDDNVHKESPCTWAQIARGLSDLCEDSDRQDQRT
jgi:ubiquitin C